MTPITKFRRHIGPVQATQFVENGAQIISAGRDGHTVYWTVIFIKSKKVKIKGDLSKGKKANHLHRKMSWKTPKVVLKLNQI
jgi:hypothetical protein